MIDPEIRTRDVDPDALAWLNSVLARRAADGPGVTIVHRGGTVVHVVPRDHPGVAVGDQVDDPATLVAAVRDRTGDERVVAVDRDALDDLSAELVELGRSCTTQSELLWRARELWNRHPAVTQAPAPGPSRWPVVAELLRSVPDGGWVVATAEHRDGGAFVLAGEVDGGSLVTLTSCPPPAARIALELRLPVDELEAALLADDPGSLLAQVTRHG